MLTRLARKDEKGFTLIELMIVIAIIGILAAIAIPQFSAYRKRSFNAAANADCRNLATAQEAYFVDESTYCSTLATITGATYGYFQSGDVVADINGASDAYSITTYNTRGDRTFSLTGPGGKIGH
jgi:type IV pilus assembly protein PilA